MTSYERFLVRTALENEAAAKDRQAKGRKYAGPVYADLRAQLRRQARDMRALVRRFEEKT